MSVCVCVLVVYVLCKLCGVHVSDVSDVCVVWCVYMYVWCDVCTLFHEVCQD